MDTATFNGLELGDGLLEFTTGNIERQVIERQLLGKDGVVTRDRGGGRQTIRITCYRLCGDAHERATYVSDLARACGNAKATLQRPRPSLWQRQGHAPTGPRWRRRLLPRLSPRLDH